MKTWCCMLSLAALLCTPALSKAVDRFEDDRIGVALDVPTDWDVSGEDGQYLLLSPDESIAVSLVSLDMTAEEFTATVMDEMYQQIEGSLSIMPDCRLLGSRCSLDLKDPGLLVAATHTLGEEEKTRLVMVCQGGGQEMLSITCTFLSGDTEAAVDTLRQVLTPLREDSPWEAME